MVFCSTEVHYTCRVMFFIIKVSDWTIAQVAVRPTSHLLQPQTFQVPIRKATFISKFQLFYLSSKGWRLFFRWQDTIFVPKIRYAICYIACFASLQYKHYRNLHFGSACLCDAKYFITYAMVIGKSGRMFMLVCPPPLFFPIRNHIFTLNSIAFSVKKTIQVQQDLWTFFLQTSEPFFSSLNLVKRWYLTSKQCNIAKA